MAPHPGTLWAALIGLSGGKGHSRSRGLYSQYLEGRNQEFETSQQYKAKGVPGQPELHNKNISRQILAWWQIPLIPALRRQRQVEFVSTRPVWSCYQVLGQPGDPASNKIKQKSRRTGETLWGNMVKCWRKKEIAVDTIIFQWIHA